MSWNRKIYAKNACFLVVSGGKEDATAKKRGERETICMYNFNAFIVTHLNIKQRKKRKCVTKWQRKAFIKIRRAAHARCSRRFFLSSCSARVFFLIAVIQRRCHFKRRWARGRGARVEETVIMIEPHNDNWNLKLHSDALVPPPDARAHCSLHGNVLSVALIGTKQSEKRSGVNFCG